MKPDLHLNNIKRRQGAELSYPARLWRGEYNMYVGF